MKALISLLLFFLLSSSVIAAPPPKASAYLQLLYDEASIVFPEFPVREVLASQIEQETCYHDTHRKCWNPEAELLTFWDRNKTQLRENGVGLPQFTLAVNRDGRVRVNTFAAMRNKYPSRLGDVRRETFKQHPELQIRGLLLLDLENWHQFSAVKNDYERMFFMLAAYNGGARDVKSAMRSCGVTAGCDADKWFGNVEKHIYMVKGRGVLYGGKTAADINTEYVRNVIKERLCDYTADTVK